MRLTQDLPVLGFYLDSGSEKVLAKYDEPIHPEILLKLYKQPGVSRIFDNGYVTIANVGAVSHAR
jgi:hypothetical protein